MKKVIVSTFLILAAAGLALAFLPAARDEIQFRWAACQDETAGYESYLRAWPEGRHAADARARSDQHGWADAKAAGTVQGFECYVQLHPGGEHVAEARDSIDSLHWKEAAAAGTVAGFERYSGLHPEGRYIAEAKQKSSALRADPAPYEAALGEGTEAALKKFIADFPGHAKEADANQVLKDITEGRDIVDLLKEKKIEIKTQGGGIQSVSLSIRRLAPYPLTVRIPVGTYFVSADSSVQNMVTTAESSLRLETDEWQDAWADAACANMPRDIPGEDDRFTVQRSPHRAELAKLMPILEKAGVSYPVRQAAVWIVTDDADYDELGILVSRPAFQPFGGTREIEESETVQAMRICSEAGVNLKQKAIWNDREMLYWRLDDDADRSWLENQDKALAQKAERVRREMDQKIAAIDPAITQIIGAKPLSIYIGIASPSSGPKGAWAARYLRKLGHTVTVGSVTFGETGITIHYQEGLQNEATALSSLFSALFRSKPEMEKTGDDGIGADEDIVIWFD